MSGRSTIMMYGGPPRPQPWVKPAQKTTTSDTIPTVPIDLTELHPCLECKRMQRGEVCPFCLRENFTKMAAALADLTTAMQTMRTDLQFLKEQLASAAKKRQKKRQHVPVNPDRARKKRP